MCENFAQQVKNLITGFDIIKTMFKIIILWALIGNLYADSVAFNHSSIDACSAGTEQVFFDKGFVYHITMEGNIKTYTPLGSIGPTLSQASEIWQSASPYLNQSNSDFLLRSGYSFIQDSSGMKLVVGLTAGISKSQCHFQQSLQAWSCTTELREPSDKVSKVNIRVGPKHLKLHIDNLEMSFDNLHFYKQGIFAKSQHSILVWLDTERIYLTAGKLKKFENCHAINSIAYPANLMKQIRYDQFSEPPVN